MSLPWKCEQCGAGFLNEDLLAMHTSVFHKQTKIQTETRASENTIIETERAVESEDDSEIDEAERKRLEEKFAHLKVVKKLQPVRAPVFATEYLEELTDTDEPPETVSEDEAILLVNVEMDSSGKSDKSKKIIIKQKSGHESEEHANEQNDEECTEKADEQTNKRAIIQNLIKTHSLAGKMGLIEKRKLKNHKVAGSKIANVQAVFEFPCTRCEEVFSTKHERRMHMVSHARDLRYFCQVCSKGFRKKQGLVLHENVHTEGSHHQCPHCHNMYRTERYLKEHIKLHIPEEYKFICNICKKAFAHKSAYRYHLLSHYNVTPFVCSLCGKGYRQKLSLEAHMNMHAGRRPYTCTHCGAGFRMKHTLRDHERLHSEEKPFFCRYAGCGKSFRSNVELCRHRGAHGETPLACPAPGCGRAFLFRSQLDKHAVRHAQTDPAHA